MKKQHIQALRQRVACDLEEEALLQRPESLISKIMLVHNHFKINGLVANAFGLKSAGSTVKSMINHSFVDRLILNATDIAFFYDTVDEAMCQDKPIPPAVISEFEEMTDEDVLYFQGLTKKYFKVNSLGKHLSSSLSWRHKNSLKKHKHGTINSANYWKKLSEFHKNIATTTMDLTTVSSRNSSTKSNDIARDFIVRSILDDNTFVIKHKNSRCECTFNYSSGTSLLSLTCCHWRENMMPQEYVARKLLFSIALERFTCNSMSILKFLGVNVAYQGQASSSPSIIISGGHNAVVHVAGLLLKSFTKLKKVDSAELERHRLLLFDQLKMAFSKDITEAIELVATEVLFYDNCVDKLLINGLIDTTDPQELPSMCCERFNLTAVNIHEIAKVVNIYTMARGIFMEGRDGKETVNNSLVQGSCLAKKIEVEGYMGNRFLNSVSMFINLGSVDSSESLLVYRLLCFSLRPYLLKMFSSEKSQISGDVVQRVVHGGRCALIIYAYGKLAVEGIRSTLNEFLKQAPVFVEGVSTVLLADVYSSLVIAGARSISSPSLLYVSDLKEKLQRLSAQLLDAEGVVTIISRRRMGDVITLEKVSKL